MALADLGKRLRDERQRVGLDQRAMAAVGGVSRNSQLAYEAGRTPPSSDYLLAVQDAGIDVAFLFTGLRQQTGSRNLGLVEDSDWIPVPTFDLAELRSGDKGEVTRTTPMRRDWLNTALGTSTGLWLAALPNDYPPIDMAEGEKVICRDIAVADLRDRNLCIWRTGESQRLFVGRFSMVRPESIHIDHDGEYWVGRVSVAMDDPEPSIFPVGRILGRPLAQIR